MPERSTRRRSLGLGSWLRPDEARRRMSPPFALAAVIGPSQAHAPRRTVTLCRCLWARSCCLWRSTCPRVKGDASQRPNAPGARVERTRAEVPPPRIYCWPTPPRASIICSSSPNLPRSVSLRADQPVLVVHVVGQVRLLLRAMRGGLGFQRVDLPALVPLSLTGIWRAGGSLTGPDGAKLVVVPLSFGQRGGSCLWRWVFRAARFELRGGFRAGD